MTQVFCSAPYNALVVNPDNNLVACYEVTNNQHILSKISTFGSVKDGIVCIDHLSREHFYSLQRERFDQTCRTCFCRWNCAGDCYTRSFSPTENGHLEQNLRCSMNREITKQIILQYIWENEGVWGPFGKTNKEN